MNMPTDVRECKLRGGNRWVTTKIAKEGDRLFLSFPYNEVLKDEVKAMQGAKWHGFEAPPRKVWSVKDCRHNWFQLNYLMGNDPFEIYDQAPAPYITTRTLFKHQLEMVAHGLLVHYGIWAAEMGCGKTLAAIELIEESGFEDVFWIGPRSALQAVKLEFRKWGCDVRPEFMTYAKLRGVIDKWPEGRKAPHVVIFDESSRVKTPTALRSQAAMQLAEGVREDWGDKGFVILMSGSPAPKSPADWWMQCSIACPGYLREGDIHKFKNRMSIVEQREQPITGGVYPHLVTWLDDEKKCAKCGLYEADHVTIADHLFKTSINEVETLYRRMTGLVKVFFKKDCLDLPEKTYKVIECKPSDEILRVAQVLVDTAPRVITGLESMRELSDGFQYSEEQIGMEECPLCKGTGRIDVPIYEKPENTAEFDGAEAETENVICDKCGGFKKIPKFQRVTTEVPCPKEDVLIDLLDEYSEQGRVVIYGGFTGSIDRIVKVCQKQKWDVLRVDGRGWHTIGDGDSGEYLEAFDRTHPKRIDLLNQYPRLAFVGQPGAAGMGLNLTASPVIIYYSNDFNAESRIQSEDRIHRTGMDTNRGATIIDLVHLETDYMIMKNLKAKRKLQAISLGDFKYHWNERAKRTEDIITWEKS